MIAKDLMTIRPKVLYTSDTLESAIHAFGDYKVSSVAILNPEGGVVGALTENLVLEIYLASFPGGAKEKLIKFKNRFLPVTSVSDRDSAAFVIKVMQTSETGRLWVKDSQDHLVGVISPKDIFQLLRGEARSVEPMHDELARIKEDLKAASAQAKRTSDRLNRLESIVNGSTYMMHSVDLNGQIVLANRRIHEVLEYNYGELVGKSIEDLYGDDIARVARSQLSRLAEGKEQDVIRTSFRRKTGGMVRVEIMSAAVKDRDGRFIATSSISRLMDSDGIVSEKIA